jgi:CENP-Q, a CENPA-CAD centromere complex subunit
LKFAAIVIFLLSAPYPKCLLSYGINPSYFSCIYNDATQAPIVGSKRKRGRPSNASIAGSAAGPSVPEQQTPKKRGRRSNAHPVDRNQVAEVPLLERDASRQRAKKQEDSAPQYQHLAAVTRGVARHTIDTKWEPLTSSAVDRISQLLNDVERSVVIRLQDERKRTQASTAVQMVVRRLHRKLTRGQPFPPSTRSLPEEDFDFEKILGSSRALEARLTPMLHSIELLKAETAKEKALLEAEADTLETLEANAKAEASRRRRAERTLHNILWDGNVMAEDSLESSGLVHRKSQQRSLDVGPLIEDT